MKNMSNKSDSGILRQKAEELFKMKPRKTTIGLTEADFLKLIQEFEVHQIELELQNEELIKAKELAEVNAKKSTDIYDLAPSGYFTLSNDGKISDLNNNFAKMLGKEYSNLINTQFSLYLGVVSLTDFNNFFQKVFEGIGKVSCEVLISSENNSSIFVIIEGALSADGQQCIASMVDITEYKKVEEANKVLAGSWQSTFNSITDFITVISIDHIILEINQAGCDSIGLPREKIIGRKCHDLVHQSNSPILGCPCSKGFTTGKMEVNEIFEHGRYYLATAWPIFDENKNIFAFSHSVKDITEQKLTELALIENEKKYRGLFEANRDGIGIFYVMPDGSLSEFIETNEATALMLGYSKSELKTMKASDLEIDINEEKMGKRIFELQTNGFSNFETSLRHKNGSIILAEMTVLMINYENKPALMNITKDITEHKKAEELVKQEKLFSDMLIESLPGIFYMFDSNFTPLRWNLNKAELLGLTNEEMKTHNTLDFIAERDKEKVVESFKKAFTEGESQEVVHIIRHDGKEFAYHLTGKRLDTAKGPMLLGVGIDVNERVKAQEELIIALAKAEESDKLKTAFLQNMSHEIRTPLNGIIGFSRLLHDEDISKDEILEYTEVIHQSGNRLIEIVNNVLDISKIETGQIVINTKPFSINSLITDLYSFFSPIVVAKNIGLNYHKPMEDTHSLINSDEDKINQIFTNLISNAIKFTSEGNIDFGYELKNGTIEFFVKDTGIGIPEDMNKRIFERFAQVNLSITRGYEGAGIGLAICKGLIEKLGGKIWFESQFNQGTTFYFDLPYVQPQQVKQDDTLRFHNLQKMNKTKILIVEDDFTSYIYLSKVLKNDKFLLVRVENGSQAVELVKNSPDIDLVLMDIRMPIMNGFEATIQIKNIRPELPIIAQTAYAFTEEKEKILAIGCDDYLSKPINHETLLKLIEKYAIKGIRPIEPK